LPGYIIGSGLDFLVNLVRYRISDLKSIYNTVVQEDAGTAAGTANEIFSTDYMPIASGFDTHLRAGRWYYTKVSTDADAVGLRAYVFSTTSGQFRIPTNATYPTSGDRAKVSYTWLDEQPTKFTDDEIKMYLGDAITTVDSTYYDFGYTFLADNTTNTFTISPTPTASGLASYVYTMYASYLIKKQLESEGFGDRIFVRDINITIDTSKGLNDLQRSSKDLMDNFRRLISEIKLKGQESIMARIDTYSSAPIVGDSYRFDSNYTNDGQFF